MKNKWEVKIKQYTDPDCEYYYKEIVLTTDDISDVQELKDAMELFSTPHRTEIVVKSVEVERCSED